METVNARLASLPDLLGYDSPAALAKACGIDPNTLRKAMQGPSNPSFEVLKALTTKNPSLSVDWLLHGTGSPLRDAPVRILTPLAAAEPVADYTSAEATTNTLYISILKEQVADLKADKSRLLSENVDLRDEVKMLLGKPFDSPDAADELPVDPNAPTFSGDGAPNPHLRGRRLGFQQQRAAGLS